MRALRLNRRTALLIIAEAALVYGAIIGAVYLRVGVEGAHFELVEKHGYCFFLSPSMSLSSISEETKWWKS